MTSILRSQPGAVVLAPVTGEWQRSRLERPYEGRPSVPSRLRTVNMSKWFRGDRKVPQAALDRIVQYFHRLDRPAVYLGPIAMEVGYSLRQTEEMLDVLVEDGTIRHLEPEEKRALGLELRAIVFALSGSARPSKVGL